jgi:hypothetical protein
MYIYREALFVCMWGGVDECVLWMRFALLNSDARRDTWKRTVNASLLLLLFFTKIFRTHLLMRSSREISVRPSLRDIRIVFVGLFT